MPRFLEQNSRPIVGAISFNRFSTNRHKMMLPEVSHEGEAEDEVLVMDRRLVVEDVLLRHPLPARSARRLNDRSEAAGEEGSSLAEVDHVEDDSLVLLGVLHREVEPEPEQKRSRNQKSFKMGQVVEHQYASSDGRRFSSH